MARIIISPKYEFGGRNFLSEVIEVDGNGGVCLGRLIDKVSIVNSELLRNMLLTSVCVARIGSMCCTLICPIWDNDEVIVCPPSENVEKEWTYKDVEEYYRYA